MKKIATLTLGCLLGLTAVQAQTFSDDFESYTLTTPLLGMQSPDWRTWTSTTGGGAEDVAVVSTDNHTVAGSKSIYFSSTSATGGPDDVILPFTTGAPLNTGQFSWKSWFKIPTAKTAYFNFQGTSTMGGMYVLDCWMNAGGAIQVQNTGTIVSTGTFPVGAWFEMEIKANFNANAWELLINGVSQGTWSNANNQVWGIDYYPADAAASFWVDDVSYNVTPYTLPALNAAGNLLNISMGLASATRFPAVTVRNLGTSVINSFDISITQNGGAPVVKNVTGLTLASLANTIQTYTVPFTLVAGSNTFVATISNVNGAGADGDPSDDVLTTVLNPVVTPAAGKMVVAEEGTGTWCQWCPRGAVFMDIMDTKYAGFIAPIAVHNGDPMTVTAYDAAIGALIGGYPSALVDRLPEIDPSGLETDFLTRIVVAPKAFVMNGATYNSTTRVLNVSVTYTNQALLTGNYKALCVITENDVTGTTGYAQSNAYAGGGAGPMGGFELLANPVPASQMQYDFVARMISPSFAGTPNAQGTTTAIGGVFTWTYSFTLPAGYDDTQVHIVGMLVDPTGKIENADYTTIPEAVANGYVTGSGVGINDIASAPDAQVSVYPNPTANTSTISLNLAKASTVSVAIYAVDGSLVGSKSYGELNGAMLLPVDLTIYNAGLYFVNVTIDGNTSVLKLVKQ